MNSNESSHPAPSIDWTIMTPSLLLVVSIGGSMIAFPEAGENYAGAAMDFVTAKLGWLYLALGGAALVFTAWLAFGPYSKVVFGTPGEKPEYSDPHWIAMTVSRSAVRRSP